MKTWNEAYVPVIAASGGSFELEENFCEVERLMFRAMVLYQISDKVCAEDLIGPHMCVNSVAPPLINFQIRPQGNSMTVLVNREIQSGYWDYPIRELKSGDCQIALIHFFDWANYDCPRKYEFYRGRIGESGTYPETVGKHVLVPVEEAEIHYVGAEQSNGGDAERLRAPHS